VLKKRNTSEGDDRTPSFIGRKFSSSASLDECVGNFATAAERCYPVTGGLTEAAWNHPPNEEGAVSTQGGGAAVPPARFVALGMDGGLFLYLAVWEGLVGYGGDGVAGGVREMWFVPPGFDGSPIQIAGVWKSLDPSLSSIGTVESTFWCRADAQDSGTASDAGTSDLAQTGSPDPGWYTDPLARFEFRYWDGLRWTEHVSNGGNAMVDPL
jgi:hypothetical protein